MTSMTTVKCCGCWTIETAGNVYAVAAGVVADESYSSPAITATSLWKRIKARDRASLITMQQDVEQLHFMCLSLGVFSACSFAGTHTLGILRWICSGAY